MNEDLILQQKDEDRELLSSVPKEISEIGNYMDAKREKKKGELMNKLNDKFNGEILQNNK